MVILKLAISDVSCWAAQIVIFYCMLAPSCQTWAQKAVLILHTTALQQIFITHSHSPIGWNRSLLHFAITDVLFSKEPCNPFALHQQPAAKERRASLSFLLFIHQSGGRGLFFIWPEQSGPRPDLHCTWVMPASERVNYNVRMRIYVWAGSVSPRTALRPSHPLSRRPGQSIYNHWMQIKTQLVCVCVCVYVSGWARACAIDHGRCDVADMRPILLCTTGADLV
jgi:hypothetical protein